MTETEALAKTKALARVGAWRMTKHARQRVTERGISREDTEAALAWAQRCECQSASERKWLVRGLDTELEPLAVVIVFAQQGLVVVTAFRDEP